MRKLISGIIGVIWGASLLIHWGVINNAQNAIGVAIGAVLFIGGVYYIFLWNKEKAES